MVPWLFLLLAAACEMVWPIGFKYSQNFTKLWPTVGTMLVMVLSFGLLALASRGIPVGTAYAIWTGLGAAGVAVLGMVLFHEPRDVARLVCIGLIIAGAVGLKLFETPH